MKQLAIIVVVFGFVLLSDVAVEYQHDCLCGLIESEKLASSMGAYDCAIPLHNLHYFEEVGLGLVALVALGGVVTSRVKKSGVTDVLHEMLGTLWGLGLVVLLLAGGVSVIFELISEGPLEQNGIHLGLFSGAKLAVLCELASMALLGTLIYIGLPERAE